MPSLLHVLPIPLLLSLAQAALSPAPEDLFAFPRYSVTFLNALPLDNHTAQAWLAHGISGGLDEFLGRPPPYSIESGTHPLVQADQAYVRPLSCLCNDARD
jgi:protein OS-9